MRALERIQARVSTSPLVDTSIDLLDDQRSEAPCAEPFEPMDDVGLTATRAEGTDLSKSASALVSGSTIGRYVVLHVLGEGAMGQVYAGFDVQLDRKVAIKVLRAELVSTSVRERTLREAKALAKLSHPNVVQVYDLESTLKHARRGRILKNLASRTYSNSACAGSISGSNLNPCRH